MCGKRFPQVCAGLFLIAVRLWAEEPPAVFWASEPVRPGEGVAVIGERLGAPTRVEMIRLPDGRAGVPGRPAAVRWGAAVEVGPLQPQAQSLKFIVPPRFKPGVYAFRVHTAGGTVERLVNRPRVWWAQGDGGTAARPGGWIRAFGLNLGWEAKDGLRRTVVRLEGPQKLTVRAESDGHALRADLPADLPCGAYRLFAHNGAGGCAGWSDPVPVTIAAAESWPQTVFDVKQFGALGDGVKDDTAAIQRALRAAAEQGGGVVLLPQGRYAVSDALILPPRTVLRGERQDLVALAWPAFTAPPFALLYGTNTFGVEQITLYAKKHRHVIAADISGPDAGDVFLRQVRVRANAYRGHPKPAEVDELFRESLTWSTGGGDTVRLGGRNIEITDCDFYGSGRALFLSRVRGGRVARNRFANGRWGWYCISGSDGLVFEENLVRGADLMSTGGGLNCLDGSRYSQNIYYARNRLEWMHGWDREAMTSDAGGEAFSGYATRVRGTTLTLDGTPNWRNRAWDGAGVFILAGTGAGQVRRVVGHGERSVEVDRPWDVEPDARSFVCVTMFQGHYLILDNDFSDCGAMQFYGTAIENVVAGNTGARMSGFRGLGLWYHGYQPNWFCTFCDNAITEGNYYHWHTIADAVLEISGRGRAPYSGPMNIGAVVRRNRLEGNAHIRVAGAVRDVIVEANRVAHATQGVFVSGSAESVLVRDNNRFEDVDQPLTDEPTLRRLAEARLARYLNRPEPVAHWSFEAVTGDRIHDGSENGFHAEKGAGARLIPEGVRGPAVSFDGTGGLRVNEPAVFNAPDMTVSLWIKPKTVRGRRGLVGKRFGGCEAPFILSQSGARLAFEATQTGGGWTFNMVSPEVLREGVWTHVAAVARRGSGITLYADGKQIAGKANAAERVTNSEPLMIGRESWGGEPARVGTPGFFIGEMDEVKVWTRALSPEEIAAEAARP
jgi:hypothetical protein